MADARKSLSVSVVSAEREIWSGTATQVVARTTEGEIGILVGHEPVLGILASGDVRVLTTEGELITANAEDGFLSVQNDVVTIVAGTAALV